MLTPDNFLTSGTQDFATASNWSTGVVPNNTNDAFIGLASPITVISSVSETVDSIGTGAADVLDITGGTFQVFNGTGPNANDGTIDVHGAVLNIGGAPSTPFDNVSTLAVDHGGVIGVNESITGAGTIDIGAGSTLNTNLENGSQISSNIKFTGGGATLELSGTASFGEISGAVATDRIYFFGGVGYAPVTWQENAAGTGGTLSYGGFTFQLAGQYTSADFVLDVFPRTSFVDAAYIYITAPFPQIPGNVDEWIMNNGYWFASARPGPHPSGYEVACVGDFTGSGTDGILWFNSNTGDVDEWAISTGAWNSSVDLGAHPGNYQIADVGDFTGNGTDDVLWTSTSNGQVQTDIWELVNGKWAASVSTGAHPAGYAVVGTGDWTGSGTDGILWYNSSTGDADEWQLSGGKWAASVDLGSHPANSTDGNAYRRRR